MTGSPIYPSKKDSGNGLPRQATSSHAILTRKILFRFREEALVFGTTSFLGKIVKEKIMHARVVSNVLFLSAFALPVLFFFVIRRTPRIGLPGVILYLAIYIVLSV
ncbi:MAG: hypothetical protein HY695_24795 [Deltaproteobacteria bacterium]|nr:hypothetical protein [Deltaproteobacteria bacterium]